MSGAILCVFILCSFSSTIWRTSAALCGDLFQSKQTTNITSFLVSPHVSYRLDYLNTQLVLSLQLPIYHHYYYVRTRWSINDKLHSRSSSKWCTLDSQSSNDIQWWSAYKYFRYFSTKTILHYPWISSSLLYMPSSLSFIRKPCKPSSIVSSLTIVSSALSSYCKYIPSFVSLKPTHRCLFSCSVMTFLSALETCFVWEWSLCYQALGKSWRRLVW